MAENIVQNKVDLANTYDGGLYNVSSSSKTGGLSFSCVIEHKDIVGTFESGSDLTVTSELKPSLSILDGKFYKFIQSKSTKYNYTATCQICKTEVKGAPQSSHNFISHLKRKHGEETFTNYKRYLEEKRRRCGKKINNFNLTEEQRNNSFSEVKNLTQEDFEVKMSKFVVHSMIPFRAIEDKYFKEIMTDLGIEQIGLRLPSRRSIVKKVQDLFEQNNKNIRAQLEKIDYICTSADIWSGRRKSFFVVTGHWIDRDYQRKSAALACKRFTKTHTYDRIASLLQNIHCDFGLTCPKIVATVTDNASNFVEAFKTFGIDPNVIDSTCENGPHIFSDIDNIDQSSTDSEDDDIIEDIGIGSTPTLLTNTYFIQEMMKTLPNHYRSMSHTLHLCATFDVYNGLTNHSTLGECHRRVLNKCSVLWNFASRPKTAEIIQETLGHILSRPDKTRWNSLFDSLKQICKIKDKIHHLNIHLKIKSCEQLMEEDFLYINEYLQCSEPLASLIDILQDEKNIFFGMLLPGLVALRRKIQFLRDRSWLYCAPLVEIYSSSVETRFYEFFSLSSTTAECAAVAAVSHPSFKIKWLPCLDVQFQDKILLLFKTAVFKEILSTANENTTLLSAQGKRETTPSYMNFFDFGANDELSVTDDREAKAEIQISNYFGCTLTDVTSLEYFPAIKKVFIKYNTPLPSSAPVERLFSYATLTNRPKANRLTDNNFEIRVLLKGNDFVFND